MVEALGGTENQVVFHALEDASMNWKNGGVDFDRVDEAGIMQRRWALGEDEEWSHGCAGLVFVMGSI